MSIRLGTQLEAPEGLGPLCKDITYYFLWSDAPREVVHLVHFVDRAFVQQDLPAPTPRETELPYPVRVTIRRQLFEDGVRDRAIVQSELQRQLPPWLEGQPTDVTALDQKRKRKGKSTHSDRVDRIAARLEPLARQYRSILAATYPERELNRFARSSTPKQNETRFRAQYFIYLAFGFNRSALAYRTGNLGRWDRMSEAKAGKKFGRIARQGRLHGHGSNNQTLRENVYEGYRRWGKPGVRFCEIARSIQIHLWGCRESRDPSGRKRLVQPQGDPVLNNRQIRRLIVEKFGKDHVHKMMYGKTRFRDEQVESLGPYTEAVANCMERVEADAYTTDEVITARATGTELPPLYVVRIRCVATGMILGIGFELGSETGAAYRMALFCMATDKVEFSSYFGLQIRPEEWPVRGISPEVIVDRGPGSARTAQPSLAAVKSVFDSKTPSYAGQSKATIEASNPKSIRIGDKPGHLKSNLSLNELIKREILRAIRDCDSINISSRITPQMLARVSRPTPLALWNELVAIGRTDVIEVSFHDAVRGFLTPTEFKLAADGVYLHGQRYDSAKLRATGVLKGHKARRDLALKGYMLNMSTRQGWVETADGLVQVDARLALREGEEQLFVSIHELEELGALRKALRDAHVEHRAAVQAEYERRFSESTGEEWASGHRRSGRPKRKTPAARKAARALKRVVSSPRKTR
jgi:hypothetical protein